MEKKRLIRKSLWNGRKINFDKFDAIGNIVDKYLGGKPIPHTVEEFADILNKPVVRKKPESGQKRQRIEDKASVTTDTKKRKVSTEKEQKNSPVVTLFGLSVSSSRIKKPITEFFNHFQLLLNSILRFNHASVYVTKYLKIITMIFWRNHLINSEYNWQWLAKTFLMVIREESAVALLKNIFQRHHIPEFIYCLHLTFLLLSTHSKILYRLLNAALINQYYLEFSGVSPKEKEFPSAFQTKFREVSQKRTNEDGFIDQLTQYFAVANLVTSSSVRFDLLFLLPLDYTEDESSELDLICRGKVICESIGPEHDEWIKSLHKVLSNHMKSAKSGRDKLEKTLKVIATTQQAKSTIPVSTVSSVPVKLTTNQPIIPAVGNSFAVTTVAQTNQPVGNSNVAAVQTNTQKPLTLSEQILHNFFNALRGFCDSKTFSRVVGEYLIFKNLYFAKNTPIIPLKEQFAKFCRSLPPSAATWIDKLQSVFPLVALPQQAPGQLLPLPTASSAQSHSKFSALPTTIPSSNATLLLQAPNLPSSSSLKVPTPTTTTTVTMSAASNLTASTTRVPTPTITMSNTVSMSPNVTGTTSTSLPKEFIPMNSPLQIVPNAVAAKYGSVRTFPLSSMSLYGFFNQLLLNQKKLLLNAGYRAEMTCEPTISSSVLSPTLANTSNGNGSSAVELASSENTDTIPPHERIEISDPKDQRCFQSIQFVVESLDASFFTNSANELMDQLQQKKSYAAALIAYFFRPKDSPETLSSISNFYDIPSSQLSLLVSKVRNRFLEVAYENTLGESKIEQKQREAKIDLIDLTNNDESAVDDVSASIAMAGENNPDNDKIEMKFDEEEEIVVSEERMDMQNDVTVVVNEMKPHNNDDYFMECEEEEPTVDYFPTIDNEQLATDPNHCSNTEDIPIQPENPQLQEQHSKVEEEVEEKKEGEEEATQRQIVPSLPVTPTKVASVPLDHEHIILGMRHTPINAKEGTIRYFRIGKDKKIRKLIKKYCEKLAIPSSSVQLSWKGTTLPPSALINTLGLVNYDELIVSMK